ncbi:MAG: ABC transporter substrate-binding protein [Chloroflexota bacterium]
MMGTSHSAADGAADMTRRALVKGAAIGGVGGVAVLAAACGAAGEQGAQPAPPGQNAPPVTVTYMSRNTPASREAQLEIELFQAFNQSQPRVVVNVEATGSASWGALKEKFVVRHTGGDTPDLVINNWGTWKDMSDGGMLTDLTPFVKRDKIDLNGFIPSAIESHSDAGRLWGMPVSMSVDAAGLPYPPVNAEDKSWTMERFLEYAQKLTRGTEQFGFGGSYTGFGTVGVADGTYFGQLAWDDKQKKCLMDTPLFQKGLQYWLDLALRYHVQPTSEEAAALRGGASGNIFLTGKIGMQVTLAPYSKDEAPFRWGLATLPFSGSGRNLSSRMWATALHAGKNARAERSWEVLRWLTKPENGGRFPLVTRHAVSPLLKGGSDLAQRVRQQETGVDPKAWLVQAQYSPVSGSGLLKYGEWPKVVEELTPKHREFKANQIPTPEYAKVATETINRLVSGR